jgi:hypothetical protein
MRCEAIVKVAAAGPPWTCDGPPQIVTSKRIVRRGGCIRHLPEMPKVPKLLDDMPFRM